MKMSQTYVLALYLGIFSISAGPNSSYASEVDADLLEEVMRLHGITEEQAITRLAQESLAADAYAKVLVNPPRGYAGSWFDATSGHLVVALDASADAAEIEQLTTSGVGISYVARSLSDLKDTRERIEQLLDARPATSRSVASLSVDPMTNSVKVSTLLGAAPDVESVLQSNGIDHGHVTYATVHNFPSLSSDIRGGDAQENVNFGGSPCTIGASIVGGYITAGHCGYAGHVIENTSGTQIGTVQASQWSAGTAPTFDGAWVSAASGWTPQPKVNGYTDGELTVAAKWSGHQVAPLNATICRYGGTTGGPDCGTVAAFDQDVNFIVGYSGGFPIYRIVKDLTKAEDICSDAGDSGGPYVFSSGQIQGTNSGGYPCSDPREEVWFQPIGDTLGVYSKTLLSAHGAQKADANGHSCPDFFNSGNNVFYCKFDSYDSQGDTSWTWISNAASSTSATFITSSCAPSSWVTVNLAITNPYGTKNYSSGFTCPSGPTP